MQVVASETMLRVFLFHNNYLKLKMKILNHVLYPFKKYSKGMLAIFAVKLIAFVCIFTFDSCKKQEVRSTYNHEANQKFRAAVEKHKALIGSTLLTNTPISNNSAFSSTAHTTSSNTNNEELPIYVEFPGAVTNEIVTQFGNINSINSLSALLQNTNAVVQYEPSPTNSTYTLAIDTNAVVNSLTPLVQDSKEFLYSKGMTEQDIQQMLIEENAPESDLVTLAMVIVENEATYPIARNYSNFFVNSAHALTWSEVGHCAVHALGIDVLVSLGSSGATAWTIGAIKTAFKKVAERMMGPIGVAIAVVDFGFCLAGVEL